MNVDVISCVGVLSRSVLFIVLYCANIFSKLSISGTILLRVRIGHRFLCYRGQNFYRF